MNPGWVIAMVAAATALGLCRGGRRHKDRLGGPTPVRIGDGSVVVDLIDEGSWEDTNTASDQVRTRDPNRGKIRRVTGYAYSKGKLVVVKTVVPRNCRKVVAYFSPVGGNKPELRVKALREEPGEDEKMKLHWRYGNTAWFSFDKVGSKRIFEFPGGAGVLERVDVKNGEPIDFAGFNGPRYASIEFE